MNQPTLQTQSMTEELFIALELSEKSWKLCASNGAKYRDGSVEVGDIAGVLRFVEGARTKFSLKGAPVFSCYEAGRDGFWVHRELEQACIENVVVDSSSIEVSRRGRQAKTDRLDVRRLVTLLTRYRRGERTALRVVRVPSEQDEDARRLSRELERLTKERTQHLTRMRGLLALMGVRELPKRKGFEASLDTLQVRGVAKLPQGLKEELVRENGRLELVEMQRVELEKKRAKKLEMESETPLAICVKQLVALNGLGELSATKLGVEFFAWRTFKNRREVGAAAGLVSMPYDSGNVEKGQGISKAGNKRVRTLAIQLAWGWLRHQPNSALSRWFRERFAEGKRHRRIGIVAVARRLLVDLWRYLTQGVVPEGVVMKQA